VRKNRLTFHLHKPRRASLFWDTDPKKHFTCIIERMLDFGNDRDVRWLSRIYPRTTINCVVHRLRILYPQKASFSSASLLKHFDGQDRVIDILREGASYDRLCGTKVSFILTQRF